MANYPSKFTYDPEWPALEGYLRDVLDHQHELGVRPGQDLDNLIALLTRRDRDLEDHLAGLGAGMTLNVAGDPALGGAVVLNAGPNITLSESGQNITIGAASSNPRPFSVWAPGTLTAVTLQKFTIASAVLSQIDVYFQNAPAAVSPTSCANLHIHGSAAGSLVFPFSTATPEYHLGVTPAVFVAETGVASGTRNLRAGGSLAIWVSKFTATANGQIGTIGCALDQSTITAGESVRIGLVDAGAVVSGNTVPAYASIPWLTQTDGNPAYIDVPLTSLPGTPSPLTLVSLAAPVNVVSGSAYGVCVALSNATKTGYGVSNVETGSASAPAYSGNGTAESGLGTNGANWITNASDMQYDAYGAGTGLTLAGLVQVDITLTGTPATPGGNANISIQV